MAAAEKSRVIDVVVPPLVSCEDCGCELTSENYRPLDLMRRDPLAPSGKRARAGGRRFRIWHLCRRCAGVALIELAAQNASYMRNGVKRLRRVRDRIPPKRGGRPRLLSDEQLRAAHVLYDTAKLPMHKVVELLQASGATGTTGGLLSALHYGWKRLGFRTRPRGVAMAMGRFGTDGTKTKPQLRRCSRTNESGPRRGRRCQQWAKRGKDVCRSHDVVDGAIAA